MKHKDLINLNGELFKEVVVLEVPSGYEFSCFPSRTPETAVFVKRCKECNIALGLRHVKLSPPVGSEVTVVCEDCYGTGSDMVQDPLTREFFHTICPSCSGNHTLKAIVEKYEYEDGKLYRYWAINPQQ